MCRCTDLKMNMAYMNKTKLLHFCETISELCGLHHPLSLSIYIYIYIYVYLCMYKLGQLGVCLSLFEIQRLVKHGPSTAASLYMHCCRSHILW
jgi:hypothetical protein